MSDPFAFASSTPRHALPHLFVGQAQKEFTLNEALARIDGLLHASVEGELDEPPQTTADGKNWIVGMQPTGDWAGMAGKLASRQAGNWLFSEPVAGMLLYDKAAGQFARYNHGWNRAPAVSDPSGGPTEDAEARAAIRGLIYALQAAGILPET